MKKLNKKKTPSKKLSIDLSVILFVSIFIVVLIAALSAAGFKEEREKNEAIGLLEEKSRIIEELTAISEECEECDNEQDKNEIEQCLERGIIMEKTLKFLFDVSDVKIGTPNGEMTLGEVNKSVLAQENAKKE